MQPVWQRSRSGIPRTKLSSNPAELWQEQEPQGAIEEAVGSWPPARCCRRRGEGVDKGRCSAATVTFSYTDLRGECTVWPHSRFWNACFLAYLQHYVLTYDTKFAHMRSPVSVLCRRLTSCPLPRPQSSYSVTSGSLLLCTHGALQPHVLTEACCTAVKITHIEIKRQAKLIS